MTPTSLPCQARCSPAVSPAGPPPTTAASWTTGAGEAAPEASGEISAAVPALELGSGPMAAVPLCSGIVTEVAPRLRAPTRDPRQPSRAPGRNPFVELVPSASHVYTDRTTCSRISRETSSDQETGERAHHVDQSPEVGQQPGTSLSPAGPEGSQHRRRRRGGGGRPGRPDRRHALGPGPRQVPARGPRRADARGLPARRRGLGGAPGARERGS